ncbi:MAG: hypothetical protein SGILL_005752 [Bacillariaceae sp.]
MAFDEMMSECEESGGVLVAAGFSFVPPMIPFAACLTLLLHSSQCPYLSCIYCPAVEKIRAVPVLRSMEHAKVPLKDAMLKILIQEQALQTLVRKAPEERIIVTIDSESLKNALDQAVQNVAFVEYLFSGSELQHYFAINIYPGLPVDTTNLELFVKNIKSNMKDLLDMPAEQEVDVNLVRLREREIQEQRAAITEAADKGVSRQFRLVSVKLHPDQHGDAYLEEFETLKEAYVILKDAESRTDIMAKMTEVLYKTQSMGEAQQQYLLEQAYTTYIANHEKKADQQASNYARYQEQTSGQRANFYLETHMFRQPPRVPIIHRKKGSGTNVVVILPALHPPSTYREICMSVTLYAEETTGGKRRIVLEGDKLKEAFDKDARVTITEDLYRYGSWTLSWKATLKDPSHPKGFIDTPHSAGKEVLIEDEAKIRARQRLPGIRLQLKKNMGDLKAALRRMSDASSTESFEHKYWDLHRLMSKSRTATRDYAASMKALGYDSEEASNESADFRGLLQCLDDAQIKKSELNEVMEKTQKKQSMRDLKQRIAGMIENGTLADWILEVDKDELDVKGGEPNRIFQLLIEGKKANSLLLDAESLQFASMRHDLFSAKQCKTLSERSEDLAQRATQETERLLKEQATNDKEDKMRQELEARATIMPLRSFVRLHDLKARSELNGLLGMFMGLAIGSSDRYQIRVDGADFALKVDNFTRIDVDFENQPVSPSKTPTKAEAFRNNGFPAPAPKKTMQTPVVVTPNKTPTPKVSAVKPASAPQKTQGHQSNAKLPHAWIPKTIVAPFIGSKGAHVKKLSKETGAGFFLDQKHLNADNNCFPLTLKGPQENIDRALDLVEKFLGGFNYELTPPRSTPKPAAPSTKSVKTTPNQPATKTHPPKPSAAQHIPSHAPPKAAEAAKPTVTPVKTPAQPQPTAVTTAPVVANEIPPPGFMPPTAASAATAAPFAPMAAAAAPQQLQSAVAPPTSTPAGMDSLLLLLCQQASCFKCKPAVFYEFLKGMDVSTLQDLKEATEDEEFMPEMLSAGLKGFKKAVFKRAVASAVDDSETNLVVPTMDNGLHSLAMAGNNGHHQQQPQRQQDLECPISLELMTKDPVIAADGITYERHAIESWFMRHKEDPNGIRSPTTNMPLAHFELIPNRDMLSRARQLEASRGLQWN